MKKKRIKFIAFNFMFGLFDDVQLQRNSDNISAVLQ